MRVTTCPNGDLLVPARAESESAIGDGLQRIGPGHPAYAAWQAAIDDGRVTAVDRGQTNERKEYRMNERTLDPDPAVGIANAVMGAAAEEAERYDSEPLRGLVRLFEARLTMSGHDDAVTMVAAYYAAEALDRREKGRG